MADDPSQFEHDLEIFLEEADKKILKARNDFVLLLKGTENTKVINSLLRTFHNLKSSAYSLNLPNLRRITHLAEEILIMIRDNEIPINNEPLDLIIESINYIDELIITLNEYHFEGRKSPVSFILKLKEFIDEKKKDKNQK